MREHTYQLITGRMLELDRLDEKEAAFLSTVEYKYREQPDWTQFAAWWNTAFQHSDLSPESVAYRICQDLEARLGIAQGKVARPDYRDYLVDLIEERYGSRYRFCKETGVDPGHLSRVLASRSDLSIQSLQHILEALHAVLIIQPEEELSDLLSAEGAAEALAGVARLSRSSVG
jgi:transcriptional regulator with XRE-family HTH domain